MVAMVCKLSSVTQLNCWLVSDEKMYLHVRPWLRDVVYSFILFKENDESLDKLVCAHGGAANLKK